MVILWDLTDPAAPRRVGQPFLAHTASVRAMAFASDGRTLATASNDVSGDGTVILWDLTDPAAPHQLGQLVTAPIRWVSSVALTPDGRTLATGGSGDTVILWDLAAPAIPRRLGQPLSAPTGSVFSVALTPDGRTLATGGSGGKVILWDLVDPAAPRQLGQPLTAPTGAVFSVVFASDRRTLATVSNDATMIRWDLTSLNRLRDHIVVRACTIAGAVLIGMSGPNTSQDCHIRTPAPPDEGHSQAAATVRLLGEMALHAQLPQDVPTPADGRVLGGPSTAGPRRVERG